MMYDEYGIQVSIPGAGAGYRNVFVTNNQGLGFALNAPATVLGALTSFDAPASNASTSLNTVNYAIGTATQNNFGTDGVSGISWGRWTGGNIDVTTPIGGATTPTANTNLHWFVTPTQTLPVNLPVTGVMHYTLAGGTVPTNGLTTGTLNSAHFWANFTNQTVDVTVNLTMSAVVINANALAMPILAGGNFVSQNPAMTCAPACGSTAGSMIGGQFTGPAGVGAGVGYNLINGAQNINGVAVFHR